MATQSTRRSGSGFALVEVLVSVVILSVSVLGAVRMQLVAMQLNRDAVRQATAVTFAREIAERMRSNKSVALSSAGNPYLFDTAVQRPTASANCFDAPCADAISVAQWHAA